MARMTRSIQEQYWIPPELLGQTEQGYCGEAADKLARLENMVEELVKSQETLAEELEQLRRQGKKNSYHFRERMGKKLTNSHMLGLLELYELK